MGTRTEPTPRTGIILIISGPAGSGKTTLCDQLLENFPNLARVITATTRDPRPGEVHGEHYYFFSNEEFEAKIAEDAFYEHALVHGRNYGTLKSEVKRHQNSGHDIILNIDVQGAAIIREKAKTDPELAAKLTTVFIRPDSVETIRNRLRGRQSDNDEEIERRVKTALEELETAEDHNYVMPTGSREQDYRIISSIYLAEKYRVVQIPN